MKRLVVLITAGLVVAAFVPVQLHAGWIKTYGKGQRDWGKFVQPTTDGGYIIAGFTASFSPLFSDDIWLLKTDSEGDTLWTRTYGGDKMDHAYCVQQTSDGGYILTGMTRSLARLGRQDLWLLKTDSEGDTLWTRVYGVDGGEYDNDEGSFVLETPDGGYIVVGTKECIAEEYGSCIWLLKIDASGDTLWTHTYHSEKRWGWNWGYCVGQTSDGGYILIGISSPPDAGCQGLSLIKTDSNGDTMWTRLYWGESSACGTTCGTSVQQTPEGGYIVTGSLTVPEACIGWASIASWLLKTDEHGDTLWTRTYKAPADLTMANCLDQTADHGYILVGKSGKASSSPSYIWLLKTDTDGDTLWTRSFGDGEINENEGYCVHQTSDGGYIITGHMDNDLCLIKTDSLGYVSIAEEPPVTPVTHPSNWQISASIGPPITLRYTNHPQGFHASIFNAVGRRVDELHSTEQSGTITWPVTHQSPGVYFIRSKSDRSALTRKVVLIR